MDTSCPEFWVGNLLKCLDNGLHLCRLDIEIWRCSPHAGAGGIEDSGLIDFLTPKETVEEVGVRSSGLKKVGIGWAGEVAGRVLTHDVSTYAIEIQSV